MRGSDPDAAVYYLAAMLEGGEDPRFIARRMIILASEDVGNADPRALVVAVAAAHALEHVGLPEAQLNLAQAAIYLAARAEVERERARDLGRRARTCARAATCGRRRCSRDAHYRAREEARPRRGLRLPARRSARLRARLPPGGAARAAVLSPERATGRRRRDGDRDGERRRLSSTSRSTATSACGSSDFRGRRNVLLVFHPFAFTPVCEEEARDLQENLAAFEQRGDGGRLRLVRLRRPRGRRGRSSSA